MTDVVEQDGIPKWHGFMTPLLQVLSDGQPRTRTKLSKQAMDTLGLPEELRAVRLGSGGLKAKGRVGRAISHLIAATALARSSSGMLRI